MKLKNDLKIEKKDEYYVFEFDETKVKKITSRMFPILLNKNSFQSVGYGILERANMLVFEQIDEFYQVRGSIAELISANLLRDLYKAKHKVDIDLKTYEVSQFKGYDMFNIEYKWGNKHFGGVPDMVISQPKEYRTLFEIKSKNIKYYENIAGNKQVPEEELLQAKHLGYLSKTNKIGMVYVFFNDKQESEIKELMEKGIKTAIDIVEKLNLTYKTVKTKVLYYDIDFDDVLDDMMLAKDILDTAIERGMIHESKFNKKEIEALNKYIGIKDTNHMEDLDEDYSDLPFDMSNRKNSNNEKQDENKKDKTIFDVDIF